MRRGRRRGSKRRRQLTRWKHSTDRFKKCAIRSAVTVSRRVDCRDRCLLHQLIDWLTDWLTDWLADWLVDRSIDCWFDNLVFQNFQVCSYFFWRVQYEFRVFCFTFDQHSFINMSFNLSNVSLSLSFSIAQRPSSSSFRQSGWCRNGSFQHLVLCSASSHSPPLASQRQHTDLFIPGLLLPN